jgi:hypothetical protein
MFTPFSPTIGNIVPPLPIADGGTNAITASAAALALGNLQKQVDLGTAGVALVNGTGNLGASSWTTPNDGNLHPFICVATLIVTTATEVGGATGITFTDASNTLRSLFQILAGNQTAGVHFWSFNSGVAYPNTAITFAQTSALTSGGPATMYGQIWGI